MTKVKTPKTVGLVMLLVAGLFMPVAASSAKKEAAAVSESARKSGMAEAPAVLQATGLGCQMSDARKIGEDSKTKTAYYEVACAPGAMGYVLQAPKEGAPTVFSCIEANTPPAEGQAPSAPCMLPGNSDPKAALQPAVKAAGFDCVPEKARGIGQTKTNSYVEVACQGGTGYILVGSSPLDTAKPIQVQSCLMYDDAETNIKCAYGDKASRIQIVDKYAAQANNACVVKDRRFVGVSKDNSTFFEASCQDGKGYIYKVAAAGSLTETYECAKATSILGGCTLTDARQAQSEQAGLYTKLVTNAGGKCDVDKYALFPAKSGEEVAELACKDGTGAILISKPGAKGQALDCARAPIAGYKCSLTKPEAAFSLLTADLKKYNFNSCDVSNSRVVGTTEKGTTYVEVACADKLKGYMIEYQKTPTVSAIAVVGCAFTKDCKLPGNT